MPLPLLSNTNFLNSPSHRWCSNRKQRFSHHPIKYQAGRDDYYLLIAVPHDVCLSRSRSWSARAESTTSWKETWTWLRTTCWSSWRHWEALRSDYSPDSAWVTSSSLCFCCRALSRCSTLTLGGSACAAQLSKKSWNGDGLPFCRRFILFISYYGR